MKSKTNLFLLLSFLIAAGLTYWFYYQTHHHVGDLSHNNDLDDPSFKVCNEDRIPQYYSYNTEYTGGKTAIENEILKELNDLNFRQSGLLTYRFIVNCQGEIGRFRVKRTDKNQQEIEVEEDNLGRIQQSLLGLDRWNPAAKDSVILDSYYVLNFKIENSKITDIF